VAEWAFNQALGLSVPKPELVSLPDNALARFAGRYRFSEGEEAIFTAGDGDLWRVIKETNHDTGREQIFPPNLLRPISEREFVVVTQDENEGAQVDFILTDDGAIRFVRMDGRLYDPVAECGPSPET
jgi:hypothetical protein